MKRKWKELLKTVVKLLYKVKINVIYKLEFYIAV
jgi:hypothetical protein